MNRAGNNLVLLIHYTVESPADEEFLRDLIRTHLTLQHFCDAHELAGRNRISRKKYRLSRAFQTRKLPAFQFLIGLN
jgi:hypothetical protein